MPRQLHIVIAGASGRLGPHIVNEVVKAGFDVTVLTRDASAASFTAPVKIVQVNYDIQESLVNAMSGVDVVISTLPNHEDQPKLIDACIAAGVRKYIPSEFGSNVFQNAKAAALPVFKGKRITEDYLRAKSDEIDWTIIVTGGFLDWGLKVGFLLNVKNDPIRIIDGGDAKHSFTTLLDVSKAVVGVLKNPEKTRNRAVFVQSASLSQNQLLAIAQKSGASGAVQTASITSAQLVEESEEIIRTDSTAVRRAMMGFILASIYGESYGNNWSQSNDNDLLGIRELEEHEVVDVVSENIKLQ